MKDFHMRWDMKLSWYLILAYFMYALSNSLILGGFVPPIPIMPFFIPFLALCFVVKTPPSVFSFLMIFIAVGISIHIFSFIHPLYIKWISIIAICSLSTTGLLLLSFFYNNERRLNNYILGSILIMSPLLILENSIIKHLYFIALGISALISLKSEMLQKNQYMAKYRMILLLVFISSLYTINLLAIINLN